MEGLLGSSRDRHSLCHGSLQYACSLYVPLTHWFVHCSSYAHRLHWSSWALRTTRNLDAPWMHWLSYGPSPQLRQSSYRDAPQLRWLSSGPRWIQIHSRPPSKRLSSRCHLAHCPRHFDGLSLSLSRCQNNLRPHARLRTLQAHVRCHWQVRHQKTKAAAMT